MNSDRLINRKDANNDVEMLISKVKKNLSSTRKKADIKQITTINIETAKAIFLFVPLFIE